MHQRAEVQATEFRYSGRSLPRGSSMNLQLREPYRPPGAGGIDRACVWWRGCGG
jgi:hypothetical protein